MSLNPRSIATLGIGYGAIAVASLGFLGGGAAPPAPTFTPPSAGYLYGGRQTPRRDRRARDMELIWLGGKW